MDDKLLKSHTYKGFLLSDQNKYTFVKFCNKIALKQKCFNLSFYYQEYFKYYFNDNIFPLNEKIDKIHKN